MPASTSFLAELWQALGSEVTIFLVTLVFALGIRSLSNTKLAGVRAKSVSDGPVKPVSTSPRLQKTAGAVPPPRRDEPAGKSAPRGRGPSGERWQSAGAARAVAGPEAVLCEIIEGTKEQTGIKFAHRALQLYQDELLPGIKAKGTTLKEVSLNTRHYPLELYSTLVNCAIRVGKHHLVEALCEDMNEQGVPRPLSFYESAMRQLASQRQYHLALAMYDMLDKDGLRPSAVTCSCLIGFAAEVGELQRAIDFFGRLSQTTTPSIRAYMTVLRVHAKRQDYEASVAILKDMEQRGVKVDSLALNIVLATCVAADQLNTVERLVFEGDRRNPPTTDVVSYNTLMKACASRGDSFRAQTVLAKMQERGLRPNAITYNTAMDAMVRGGKTSEAWALVGELRSAGLKPDKFTSSILIKNLTKVPTAQDVRAALRLLADTEGACDAPLKSTLYHTVLEAAAQVRSTSGDGSLAAAAFAQLRRAGVTPTASAQRLVVQSLPAGALDLK